MNFGHSFIPPPLFYYFVLPPPPCMLSPPSYFQNLSTGQQGPVIVKDEQDINKIIVSKEDLIEEGYEQTKRSWTEQEDRLLMKLCSDPNILFEQVSQHLPGRNAKMCYSRFRRLTNQSKKYWTKAENEKLKSLVEQFGENWKEFTKDFPERNFKQLKDHYENYLSPNLDAGEWTVEEDLQLISLINQHGQKWKNLQCFMPHRSCSQLKNRYFGRIKRLNEKKLAMKDGESSKVNTTAI